MAELVPLFSLHNVGYGSTDEIKLKNQITTFFAT